MSIQHLGAMTWREVKEFVHDRVVVMVPLGAVVAHGPHLPLNTKVLIATEMTRRAALKVATKGRDVLVHPPMVYAPALHGAEFPGTVNVESGTYAATLLSVLRQIRGLGPRTACLVTCHVDSAHRDAIYRCLKAAEGAAGMEDLKIVFPDVAREPWVHLMPEEFRRGAAHAGRFETSCVMALQADRVREDVRANLPKVEASLAKAMREGKVGYAACGGPDAYFGDPASANAADGEEYLEALATIVFDALTGK